MTRKHRILAAVAVVLIPSGLLGADAQSPGVATQSQDDLEGPTFFTDWTAPSSDELTFLTRRQSPYRQDIAFRFGWWGVDQEGDLTKVGEYQDLDSSPFWDVDGLSSDGERTTDFFVTGLDGEGSQTGLYYFGPKLSADIDHQRFLRRLDHDPLTNFSDASRIVGEDLNIGEDFAIRVEELRANFKGNLTKNIKWRVNFWGMRKRGERQIRGMCKHARCDSCHGEELPAGHPCGVCHDPGGPGGIPDGHPCGVCHDSGGPTPAGHPCGVCHDPGGSTPAGHPCGVCHEPGGPTPAGHPCQGCHGNKGNWPPTWKHYDPNEEEGQQYIPTCIDVCHPDGGPGPGGPGTTLPPGHTDIWSCAAACHGPGGPGPGDPPPNQLPPGHTDIWSCAAACHGPGGPGPGDPPPNQLPPGHTDIWSCAAACHGPGGPGPPGPGGLPGGHPDIWSCAAACHGPGGPVLPEDHPCGKCHVRGGRQQIDWVNTEIEPVVEARFGPLSVEYSRLMQAFSRNDQVITQLGDGQQPFSEDVPYALVPDSFTQIDRLRLGVDLMTNSQFSANLFLGDTENKFRDTHRSFNGYDLELTNRSLDDRLTLSAYGKRFNESTQMPRFFVVAEEQDLISPPINYARTIAGVRSRWRPFRRSYSSTGLSLTGGYEYRLIDRDRAVFQTDPGPVFTQAETISHAFRVGASMRWSPRLDSYIRYKMQFTDKPLYGLRKVNGELNTSLPQEDSAVEIGGTWVPSPNFLLSASSGIENRHHSSSVTYFDEDGYPMSFSIWYLPTSRWSLSGGYSYDSNWINQDITLGDAEVGGLAAATNRWNYGGQSHVINLGTSYAWTKLTLSGSVEFATSRNAFAPTGLWPDLPQYSDVIAETTRFLAGIDYWLRDGITCYLRYNYFDYGDKSVGYNSGTAHMFLGGFSAFY